MRYDRKKIIVKPVANALMSYFMRAAAAVVKINVKR